MQIERLKKTEDPKMEWPASLDEYEKLVIRMNTPRYYYIITLFYLSR